MHTYIHMRMSGLSIDVFTYVLTYGRTYVRMHACMDGCVYVYALNVYTHLTLFCHSAFIYVCSYAVPCSATCRMYRHGARIQPNTTCSSLVLDGSRSFFRRHILTPGVLPLLPSLLFLLFLSLSLPFLFVSLPVCLSVLSVCRSVSVPTMSPISILCPREEEDNREGDRGRESELDWLAGFGFQRS